MWIAKATVIHTGCSRPSSRAAGIPRKLTVSCWHANGARQQRT